MHIYSRGKMDRYFCAEQSRDHQSKMKIVNVNNIDLYNGKEYGYF